MNCRNLAVPVDVMQHVVNVESSFNRYAIGVVGGRLARQPDNLAEALATARMLRARGFNFSLGLAQVNRHNLGRYDLSLERAFDACPNLQAGARILADCRARSGNDWGKALSCYYSGNFVTGFRDGYVGKVFASMRSTIAAAPRLATQAIPIASQSRPPSRAVQTGVASHSMPPTLVARRIAGNSEAARPEPATEIPRSVALAPVTGAGNPEKTITRIDTAFVF